MYEGIFGLRRSRCWKDGNRYLRSSGPRNLGAQTRTGMEANRSSRTRSLCLGSCRMGPDPSLCKWQWAHSAALGQLSCHALWSSTIYPATSQAQLWLCESGRQSDWQPTAVVFRELLDDFLAEL